MTSPINFGRSQVPYIALPSLNSIWETSAIINSTSWGKSFNVLQDHSIVHTVSVAVATACLLSWRQCRTCAHWQHHWVVKQLLFVIECSGLYTTANNSKCSSYIYTTVWYEIQQAKILKYLGTAILGLHRCRKPENQGVRRSTNGAVTCAVLVYCSVYVYMRITYTPDAANSLGSQVSVTSRGGGRKSSEAHAADNSSVVYEPSFFWFSRLDTEASAVTCIVACFKST